MAGVDRGLPGRGQDGPPIADDECYGGDLSWWLAHKSTYKTYGACFNGYQGAYDFFNVALRVLAGDGPKYQTLEIPAPQVTNANLAKFAVPGLPITSPDESWRPGHRVVHGHLPERVLQQAGDAGRAVGPDAVQNDTEQRLRPRPARAQPSRFRGRGALDARTRWEGRRHHRRRGRYRAGAGRARRRRGDGGRARRRRRGRPRGRRGIAARQGRRRSSARGRRLRSRRDARGRRARRAPRSATSGCSSTTPASSSRRRSSRRRRSSGTSTSASTSGASSTACRRSCPGWSRATAGHVVNTSSVDGIVTVPNATRYIAAKHAVTALTETLYRELETAGSNVGVSVLCPGAVATDIVRSARHWPARLGPAPEIALDGVSRARRA